jgi:hypothetical protein
MENYRESEKTSVPLILILEANGLIMEGLVG